LAEPQPNTPAGAIPLRCCHLDNTGVSHAPPGFLLHSCGLAVPSCSLHRCPYVFCCCVVVPLCVMWLQRLLLVSGDLSLLAATDAACGSVGLGSAVTSVLWMGPALLYMTAAGQVCVFVCMCRLRCGVGVLQPLWVAVDAFVSCMLPDCCVLDVPVNIHGQAVHKASLYCRVVLAYWAT
jgi:hypothetical protein